MIKDRWLYNSVSFITCHKSEADRSYSDATSAIMLCKLTQFRSTIHLIDEISRLFGNKSIIFYSLFFNYELNSC